LNSFWHCFVGEKNDYYTLEVKNCRLSIRHFRHVKKRAKAKKALTRLRTIANKLIRELQRKLRR
jgi:IS5 family transposase